MIISRREWEEKCDSNRALLKDKAEKTELIEKMNTLIEEARVKIARLEEELKHKIYKLYSTKIMQINKKAKANNSDIIDYVKIMYGLNVNAAMISYVRKDKGIQKSVLILEWLNKKMLIENLKKHTIKLL